MEVKQEIDQEGCCVGCFPVRYFVSLMAFLGVVNVYAVRMNLSLAMVAMTNPKEPKLTTCPELIERFNGTIGPATHKPGEFNWDSPTQGLLHSAFFYGYMIAHPPAGYISTKYAAKWVLGIGIFLSGVITLLSPAAARLNVWVFFFTRLALGLGTGVTFPAIHTLIGKWMPANERSLQSTIIYNGISVGNVLTLSLSGLLIESNVDGGWPLVFYTTGSFAVLWFIFWTFLIYESPYDHPSITEKEMDIIVGGQLNKPKTPIPWKAIFTSVPVYALAVTQLGNNWGFYTLITYMPTYMARVLHFDITQNGFLSSLPYVMLCLFSMIAGVIVDKIRSLEIVHITTLRKVTNSIAFFVPGVLMGIVPFLGCKPISILVLLSLSAGINGLFLSGFHVTHIDMSPEFGGLLLSGCNSFAHLSGLLAPAFVGYMTKEGNTLENWKVVFVTAAVIYIVAGLIYDIFSTAEEQPWGTSKPMTSDEELNQPTNDNSSKEDNIKDSDALKTS